MNANRDSRWYREPVMWLAVAIPLATVIAGFTTLWLAGRAPDTVVTVGGPQGPVPGAEPGRTAPD